MLQFMFQVFNDFKSSFYNETAANDEVSNMEAQSKRSKTFFQFFILYGFKISIGYIQQQVSFIMKKLNFALSNYSSFPTAVFSPYIKMWCQKKELKVQGAEMLNRKNIQIQIIVYSTGSLVLKTRYAVVTPLVSMKAFSLY